MNPSPRNGISLMELAVVIAILVVLMTLTLVGIQYVRESTRRTGCSNNLHQIGIAIQSFESRLRRLPSPTSRVLQFETGKGIGVTSVHHELLQDMEQASLSETLLPTSLMFGFFNGYGEPLPAPQALLTTIPPYLCPSDGHVLSGTNYRFCTGPDAHSIFQREIGEGAKGAFSIDIVKNGFHRFSRGISTTIVASERLMSGGDGSKIKTELWLPFLGEPYGRPTADLVALADLALQYPPVEFFKYGGHFWFVEGYECTAYNHVFTPNYPRYSLIPHFSSDLGWGAIIGANSNHAGGVNTLYADGSVSFASNEIDSQLWRTLSSCESVK